jgi:hypothetical protein
MRNKDVTFEELVEATENGLHPMEIIEAQLGQDRKDDFTDENVKVREFARIAGQCAGAVPNIGPNWIDVIATSLRKANKEGMSELIQMAQRNRDQYDSTSKIDAGGSYELWSSILRGLLAVRTDQVPPGPASMIDKPNLA